MDTHQKTKVKNNPQNFLLVYCPFMLNQTQSKASMIIINLLMYHSFGPIRFGQNFDK